VVLKRTFLIWIKYAEQNKKLDVIGETIACKNELVRKRQFYDKIFNFSQNKKNRKELKKVASYYFIAKIIRRTLTILGDHAKEQKASRFLRERLQVKSLASLQQFAL
jgi:hypothetical protein